MSRLDVGSSNLDTLRLAAAPPRPPTIAVSGATGFIGSALVDALTAAGHPVRRLIRERDGARPADVLWDPAAGTLDPQALDGVDAVIHLAGEPIAQRWTADAKQRIRESRVRGTQLIARTMASLERPPRVLVSGSAMGIYGDRGDEELDESSPPGSGFLADVATEWEAATEPAARAGLRVVTLRTGLVLGPAGGALGKMLLPFRLGVGGRIGSGRQWVSWVALHDAVRAIMHAASTEAVSGPINVCAPIPVRNAEFTTILGRVLGRPTIVPVPALAMRLLFGEMGEATLLASQRMRPARLVETGYRFRFPTLEAALRHELDASRSTRSGGR